MSSRLKRFLLNNLFIRRLWGVFRSRQLVRDYQARREHYDRLARQQNLVYRESSSIAAIRARLEERHYRPTPRKIGEVHTFAFVPDLGWHRELLTDLRASGAPHPI